MPKFRYKVRSARQIVGYSQRNAYSALRLLIALVVLGFGCWAAVVAIGQLQERHRVLNEQLAEIDAKLGAAEKAHLSSEEQRLLEHQRREVAAQRLRWENFGWVKLASGAACYAIAVLFSAVYWHVALRALGQSAPLWIVVAAHALGQLGKYVPGKAMVVVIRSAAIKRHANLEMVPAVICVFIETLTMMACGAAWAGLLVLFLPAPSWIRWLAIVLAIAAVVPTWPPLFRIVLKKLEKGRFGHALPTENQRYDVWLMLRGWFLMSLVWVMIGTSFWLLVLATPGTQAAAVGFTGWATATATVSLALVAGFLSLLPGGAGVRELVITALLAPLAGPGPALVAAILARLVFLIVESLLSALAYGLLSRREVKI